MGALVRFAPNRWAEWGLLHLGGRPKGLPGTEEKVTHEEPGDLDSGSDSAESPLQDHETSPLVSLGSCFPNQQMKIISEEDPV